MADDALYQIEVKANLVRLRFPASDGWKVSVQVDPFERGLEGDPPPDKKRRAAAAYEALEKAGAQLGPDSFFGEADLVAEHPERGKVVVEAAGAGTASAEEGLFSCLGQLVSSMRIWPSDLSYALAAPSTPEWRRQLARVPWQVRARLELHLFAVGPDKVEHFDPDESL